MNPLTAPALPAHIQAPAPRPSVASPADPNQPPLPGMESNVLARVAFEPGDKLTEPVLADPKGKAVPNTIYSSASDAITAARNVVTGDRHDARSGLFNHRQDQVNAIGVLTAAKGYKLVRTDVPLDPYRQEVPGSMCWPQYWDGITARRGVAEAPSTVALVGATKWMDLNKGTVVPATSFAGAHSAA